MLTLRNHFFIMLGIVSMMVYVGIGCSDQTDNLTPDESAIESEIEQDPELFGIDLMDEDSEDPGSGYGGGLEKAQGGEETAEAINPVAFWRRVRITRTGFNVQVDGDTAIVTLRFRLRGAFVVVTRDTVTHTWTKIFKPLTHDMERKLRFVRNQDTTSLRRWLRAGITPAYGVSEGGTMSLTGAVSIVITDSVTGDQQTLSFTNPLDYFLTIDQLPTIHPGDLVHIEVAIANSTAGDDPYGIAHRARHPGRPLSRLKKVFNDDGVDGDATADDGIYTAEWTAVNNGVFGVHLGVLDFITTSTAWDDTLPYNSLVIALPYSKSGRM